MEKKTHQRQSISLEMRIEILDRLGKGEGSTAIGKHFNLDESTVRAIKKNEAAIRKSVISGTKLSTKFASYTRDVLLERTDRAIAIWIEEQVQRRIPTTRPKGKDLKQLPVHWMANPKAWMTTAIFTEWFNNCFVPEVEAYMKEKSLDFKVLLIVDNAANLTVDGVVGLEGDDDEEEKSTPITGKLIQEGLQLCSKLENHFLINDLNSERASKLQRRATQNENEVCENPWPLPQISIAETVSSDDEGDLEPLRKRCKSLSDRDND
ncbi:tigger transposable element-derived protein 1 [Trichonephila clavipes]|nr:tigger transposable element-derived protein 1 [Trichonephila clavipes]